MARTSSLSVFRHSRTQARHGLQEQPWPHNGSGWFVVLVPGLKEPSKGRREEEKKKGEAGGTEGGKKEEAQPSTPKQ